MAPVFILRAFDCAKWYSAASVAVRNLYRSIDNGMSDRHGLAVVQAGAERIDILLNPSDPPGSILQCIPLGSTAR
jgi:hypothetical protein